MAGASFGVCLTAVVVAQLDDSGDMQGTVAGAVSAAVQPVAVRLSRRCRDWRDSAQMGERGLAAQSVGVVADRGEQRGDGVGAKTEDGAGRRCRAGGERVEILLQGACLDIEGTSPARDRTQRPLRGLGRVVQAGGVGSKP